MQQCDATVLSCHSTVYTKAKPTLNCRRLLVHVFAMQLGTKLTADNSNSIIVFRFLNVFLMLTLA